MTSLNEFKYDFGLDMEKIENLLVKFNFIIKI